MMRAEYDSPARQIQVRSELEGLDFHRYMSSSDISDESTGLKQLVDHISNLSNQCPPEFQSDPQKIRFLRNAVLDLPLAHQPVSHCTSARYDFNRFATALREALQLHLEKQRCSLATSTFLSHTSKPDAAEPETCHGQYGIARHSHPRFRSGPARAPSGENRICDRLPYTASVPTPPAKNRTGRDGSVLKCFRCGSDSHPQNSGKCTKGAIIAHTRYRLNSGTKAVHLLSELVSSMEGDTPSTNTQDSPTEAAEFDSFFTMPSAASEGEHLHGLYHDVAEQPGPDSDVFTHYLGTHFAVGDTTRVLETESPDFLHGDKKQ